MKVLIINASPRINGNSSILVDNIKEIFENNNIECDIMNIGNKNIRGCIACGKCSEAGKCVFNDDVNIAKEKLKESDGMIVVSPVYYASPNGTLISFLDRLFYIVDYDLRMKVAASFAVARRAGTTATFDVLNKYFTISGMPIASGKYWNNGFGRAAGEIKEDLEGLQNAKIVAENMIFLMKSIELGKKEFGLPNDENKIFTSFIKNN